MAIDLRSHYREEVNMTKKVLALNPSQRRNHKINLWNHFVDSQLIGITDEDCGILPRVLPLSYLQEIKKSTYLITLFAMKLLSLPTREIKAIIPSGPIRDFLIEELEVLKFRPPQLVGSFRFDMALEGEATRGNPPKLLEINDIGFGGLSRSTYLQKTLLSLLPSLKKNFLVLDAVKAESRNYRSLGNSIARFQYDAYDWEEEVLLKEAKKNGVHIQLVSPDPLKFRWNAQDYPLMQRAPVEVHKGKVVINSQWAPEIVQMGYSFELRDFKRAPEMYRSLLRSQTPQYSPFITGLVASKAILVLLDDKHLRNKFLGNSGKPLTCLDQAILPAQLLENHREHVVSQYKDYVLKHVDGLGGEKVFFDQDLLKQIKKIPRKQEKEWVMQKRMRLNTIELEGTLSPARRLIADLGVFVQYQWSGGKLRHFEVGGFITRATNQSYKVNVSGGGIQVPVFFDRAS